MAREHRGGAVGHPVVGEDNEVDQVGHSRRIHAIEDVRHHQVEVPQRPLRVCRQGAVLLGGLDDAVLINLEITNQLINYIITDSTSCSQSLRPCPRFGIG